MNFAAKLYVSAEPRRSDRHAADVAGTLRVRDGTPIDVRVVDISRHGFRCTTTADLREGDTVWIGLRGNGDGGAVIRWRRGAQVGCEFLRPLSDADTRAAISADVVVAVARWVGVGPAGRLDRPALKPALRPAHLFVGLLTGGLLVDLLNGYFRLTL